jgi:outer membrane receptor for ferrienterochelin and colicins
MNLKLLLGLLLFSTAIFAQKTSFSGQILDKNTKQAIEYANVSVWRPDSTLIAGTVTDAQGRFTLKDLIANDVQIRVQFLGYQSITIRQKNTNHQREVKIAPILLASSNVTLSELTVKAEKATTAIHIDKQVFQAKQFQNAANGTGLDLMQRLPSITVNTEGVVALRGSTGFILLIDGKPSTRSPADVLAQLPANLIESVEVVTSPSAKYDADGKAGIINIITKKDTQSGSSWTGNMMFGGANPLRFGGDLMWAYNTKKWNIYAAADYRRFDIEGYRVGVIRTVFKDTLTYMPSEGIRNYKDEQYSIRTGGSYNPNAADAFNWAVYIGQKQTDRTADLHYDDYIQTGKSLYLFANNFGRPLREFFNQNLFVRLGQFRTANIDYTHSFANKSRLTLLGIYEYSILGGPLNNYDTFEGTNTVLLHERSTETSPLTAWRWQADYSLPLANKRKLETGYQFRYVNHGGDFVFERWNTATKSWQKPIDFNDDMDLNQAIHAGYLQFSGEQNSFSYNLGLRAEYMDRTLTHRLGKQPYTLQQLNFFPTAQGFWKLPQNQSFRIAYSRRIDRPTTKLMSPFKNHRHAETIENGDPNLRPEIADVVELSYVKAWNKFTLTSTAYHNQLKDKVFRVNEIDSRTILGRTYTNAGNATATGIELSADVQPHQHWKVYLSGNFYQFDVRGQFNGLSTDVSSFNYNFNGYTTIDFSTRLRFQWDFTYLSRSVTSQGIDSELLLSNVGLRYSLWKNRGTLALQAQNIFNSNIQTIITETPTFYSSTDYRKWDRVLQLSLSFRLNDTVKKVKTTKTEYGEKDF